MMLSPSYLEHAPDALTLLWQQVEDDILRVSIVNAVNANSASTPHGGGIGQQTLQKRADHIGAKLTVEAEGTRHTLTLTLKLHTEK